MREAARTNPAGSRATWRGAAAGGMRRWWCLERRPSRRNFGCCDNLHEVAVGIAQPDAGVVGKRMRRHPRDLQPIDLLEQRLEILLVHSETQVLELLPARRLVNRSPAVRMAEGVQIDASAAKPHIQAELGKKAFGFIKCRHGEDETIQRMDRRHALTARSYFGQCVHRCLLQKANVSDTTHTPADAVSGQRRAKSILRNRCRA